MADHQPGPKTIILCFDGTTNHYSSNNSNIARLYAMLSKEDPREQVTYYQPGIGQYYTPGSVNQLLEPLARMMDWCFAWSLSQHVIDGYRFLVQNWKIGDKVLIFGFSRGAYVARCVAGMVNKVGLLAKDNDTTLTLAYRLYLRTDREGVKLSASFKKTFSRTVPIDFLGVYDTVASVGMISNRALPFTNTNNEIRIFRHALALDERRFRFQMSLHDPVVPTQGLSLDPRYFASFTFLIPFAQLLWTFVYWLRHPAELLSWLAGQQAGINTQADRLELEERLAPATDVKEVWFCGCHEDVGGSAVLNSVERSLANITLRWMVCEIIASRIPVYWHVDAFDGLFSDRTEPGKLPADLDTLDAVSPIHDALSPWPPSVMFPTWWFLELGLDSRLYQDSKDNWYWQWGINFGRGRRIRNTNPPVFHETVRQRMEQKPNYKPWAVYDNDNIWGQTLFPPDRSAVKL